MELATWNAPENTWLDPTLALKMAEYMKACEYWEKLLLDERDPNLVAFMREILKMAAPPETK